MYMTFATLLLSAAGVLASTASIAMSAPTIANGNFEKAADGRPLDWQPLGPGVTVKPFVNAGWKHGEYKINSAKFSIVRIYVGIQSGIGTIWLDNVCVDQATTSRLVVRNGSFEESNADAIAAWNKDAGDVQAIRDTSKWAPYPGQLSNNGASARFLGEVGKKTRIWQDVGAVKGEKYPFDLGKPNTDYVISFDWYAEDFTGDLCIQAYGVKSDGQLGPALPIGPLLAEFPTDQFGKSVVEISLPGPGQTGLSQRLKLLPADRSRAYHVSASVRIPKLNEGSVTLTVDPGLTTESKAAAKVTRADSTYFWRELSVNFVPAGIDPFIAIQVEANDGNHGPAALVYVDNVTVGPAEIVPMPKRLDWLPLEESFLIPKTLSVNTGGNASQIVKSGVRLFAESLNQRTGILVTTSVPKGTDEPAIDIVVSPTDKIERQPESYSLRVTQSGVKIISADDRGALYGLMTLLELIQPAPSGGHIFLAADIDDAPDLPFRGVYPVPSHPGSNFQTVIDRLARLRYNAAAFDVGAFQFDALKDPEKRHRLEQLVEYCRATGIEPIPTLQSFGWASQQVDKDLNIVEGTEVSGEKLTLKGIAPAPLAHTNIIRTESSDIQISDNQGIRKYLEGRDYDVIGQLGVANWRVGFSKDAPPFQIRRTLHTRIPDGAALLASYDYVSRTGEAGNCPYCPNEPRLYPIMKQAIHNTIRTFRPKYLHIGHDEIMCMGTDSRCRKSGRSNAENFAMEVWRLYKIAKAEDPNVRIMMWDDMINPYSHGNMLQDPTAPAADLLPKDIILNVWFHGRSDPPIAGFKSLKFFGEKGYTTTGGAYADRTCARRWSAACKTGQSTGLHCMGILHTPWDDNYEALDEAAYSSWRVPANP
jgi:hypothetical protein